jgi:hypothetical protein
MKSPALLAASICLVLPSSGCREPSQVKKLRWLHQANPTADADTAIARRDYRLRGVYGLTLSIPGTEPSMKFELEKRYGVNPIEGTSDNRVNQEHSRLIELAHSYASTYNRRITSKSNPNLPN